jgi:hypothetical protein
MNFWKSFGASMLAWVVGVVGIFIFAIGLLVSALIDMNVERPSERSERNDILQ